MNYSSEKDDEDHGSPNLDHTSHSAKKLVSQNRSGL